MVSSSACPFLSFFFAISWFICGSQTIDVLPIADYRLVIISFSSRDVYRSNDYFYQNTKTNNKKVPSLNPLLSAFLLSFLRSPYDCRDKPENRTDILRSNRQMYKKTSHLSDRHISYYQMEASTTYILGRNHGTLS